MKRKLFTFLLSACMCTMTMAQSVRPEAVIAKAFDVQPVIDGVIDDVWVPIVKHNVTLPYQIEIPTFGNEGDTYWKALWDDAGIYIIVVCSDNVWHPWFGNTDGNHKYDHVELYFDTNKNLADGNGGHDNTNGNRQIAPDQFEGKIDGSLLAQNNVQYAYNVANPDWTAEFFVPWESIPDADGVMFDKTATMGFDVTIVDNDNDGQSRKRAVWSNDGTRGDNDENWNNMDEAGHVTFEGSGDLIYVDKITIDGGKSITTNGETLQLTTTTVPADAYNNKLILKLTNGTGSAKISDTGLVTPLLNGTVTVKAYAVDGGWAESDPYEIIISGQVIDKNSIWNSLNLITNWDFNTDLSSWSGSMWGGTETTLAPYVSEGVVIMKTHVSPGGGNWDYTLNQSALIAEPNVPYTLKFKSWSSETRTNTVDFEDNAANSHNRYGVSPDPLAKDGRSEWTYNTTTDPAWFIFHVTFDQIHPTTTQQITWLESRSVSTVYVDSVLLIKDANLALLSTGIEKQLAKTNLMRVYQVDNVLTVDKMASTITKVSIYNTLGQKMMEKTANGTMTKFDVNSLRKGMYFVRLSDGTTQKFMK